MFPEDDDDEDDEEDTRGRITIWPGPRAIAAELPHAAGNCPFRIADRATNPRPKVETP